MTDIFMALPPPATYICKYRYWQKQSKLRAFARSSAELHARQWHHLLALEQLLVRTLL